MPNSSPAPPAPPASPASSSPARIAQQIAAWLTGEGLARAPIGQMVEGFCTRLSSDGVPLWRGALGVPMLHPRISTSSHIWRRGLGLSEEQFSHDMPSTDGWQRSPWRHLLERGETVLRLRLEDGAETGFPVVEALRQDGATDYVAYAIGPPGTRLADTPAGNGCVSSWVTDRPGGFSDRDIALFDSLLPTLALAVSTRQIYGNAVTLLDTYVGRDAGRRILGGEVQPGSVEVIDAALLLADFRGFTPLSQNAAPDSLVPMLNSYLTSLASPITQAGGEILKFMGDGLIATFELGGQNNDVVYAAALDAAKDALAAIESLNQTRAKDGAPVMALDIALHVGQVLYGNVGTDERLDFTMIGRAVNEVSRMEQMCEALGHNLLISADFVAAIGDQSGRFESLGEHGLRGLRRPRELFTLRS